MATRTRVDLGSFEDIRVAAVRTTGLEDFGGTAHEEGLRLLCEDLVEHGGLTPEGNYMQRSFVKSALVGRLLSEHGFAENPTYADVAIERPIFVCGLPRTGTTALHRLLNADPGHQGLELWLTEVPQPRPPRANWESNPIYQALNEAYSEHQVSNPEFMGIHYLDAGTVEECWRILRQSGKSIGFESLGYVPAYSDWLEKQDWTDAYERHRANLELIGLNDQEKRWVLKNPSHLVGLDAIMAVYPDALIVQTHREPATIIPSMCSLAEQATAGWSNKFTGSVIGEGQLELWARGLETFDAARPKYNPAQFLDVDYHDFVADPLAAVGGIYDHFGLDLTDSAETAMAAMHAESRSGARKPAHKYTLEEFGLTKERVDERFGR